MLLSLKKCFVHEYGTPTVRLCFAECPVATFKSTTSNEQCLPCPRNTDLDELTVGLVTCHCLHGYYRSPADDVTAPCTSKFILTLKLRGIRP